ncbi:MAG: dihydropteroate synthase [Rhodobacteraceae bacterium]|nr:dihydropteroate synthase [Paracoccaceae bacterium]
MTAYFRPIPQTDTARPAHALPIAGGWAWFTQAEVLTRDAPPRIIAAQDIPPAPLRALTAPRAPLCGLTMDRPHIMGILNRTPDSFSDGGDNNDVSACLHHAKEMRAAGASILDIGGESTRPGAQPVPPREEKQRILAAMLALRAAVPLPMSIDTRKAMVARAAIEAGAVMVNDVSGFTFDPALAPLCAAAQVAVCLVHMQGTPAVMQNNPCYDNVLLDVFDFLQRQIAMMTRLGIRQEHILVDPGIGFGKTQAHNLALLARLSLFHALGCPILLGASRKGFIGRIAAEPDPRGRSAGSTAVALAAVAQGVQVLRVHDVRDTWQALRLWQAATRGDVSPS